MYPWKTWSRTVIGPASARKPRAEPNWLKLLLDPGWLGDLLHLDPGGLGKLLGPGGIGRILLNPGGVVGHDGLVRGLELLGLPASWLVIVFTAFRLVHTGTGKSGSCLAEITHFLSEVETSVNTSSSPEVETSVITYSSSLSNLIKAWSNETHCDTTTSVRNTV